MNNVDNISRKTLFSLTIPIFLELLLVTVVGNIDTIMLGYYSDKAVGAIGGITQLLNIQNVIFSFVNMATAILTAQFLGAKDFKRVKQVISVSLVLNVVLGLILGGIYLFFWRSLLQRINLPEELVEIGKYYFQMVGGLCIFQGVILSCGAILKSHGRPTETLIINVGVNVLNILGNGMFIFGWLGMPILGTTGVGISTVVSRGIGCIVAFYMMCKYCNFTFRKGLIKPFPFKIVKNILSIGLPTAGENLAWNIGQLMVVAMVNTMGTTIIASRTYLMLISNFIMTLSIALGQGTAIQVGHLVGAGEKKEVYNKCLKSVKIAFVFAFVATSIVCLLRKPIMSIFTTNPDILAASLKIFPLMIILEMGRVFNIVIISSLHAAGDIKFPMFMGITCVFTVAVLFSYIFGILFAWGLVGIWIANAMDEWIRGIAMYFRWKSKKWQNKSFI
ncbi:MATE family efflux transporter [Fusobacterium simiae]|uniref:MATE family efflux transporter n=1 Tax=Fusobacterium simiae TaxID=855 RepID=UPI0020C3D493|nr:MATE family efflux transporter [Fusobacterium simiae]MDC7954610.1 MATE family efflux transporter [Fusobacterium simiae]